MEPRHDRDPPKTPAHRQSLPLSTGRRATILLRTLDHSEPPVANPNNPPEVNIQRQREYENICKLNEAMETVIDNFSQTSESIQVNGTLQGVNMAVCYNVITRYPEFLAYSGSNRATLGLMGIHVITVRTYQTTIRE